MLRKSKVKYICFVIHPIVKTIRVNNSYGLRMDGHDCVCAVGLTEAPHTSQSLAHVYRDLRDNLLTGFIPSELGNLGNLMYLCV